MALWCQEQSVIQTADHAWNWGTALPAGRPRLCDWLEEAGSLTRRLRQHCRDFRVEPLAEASLRPLGAEQVLLLGAEQAYCREVLLLCDDHPWVFASSLYSPDTREALPALAGLGRRALGELMFEAADLSRSRFQFAGLDSRQYRRLADHAGLAPEPAASPWGRRSVLSTSRARVLVTELFLPAANAYQEIL